MFLANENITLRAIEPEDLEHIHRWENDSNLWQFGNSSEPYSRYVIKQYIASASQDIYEKRQLRLIIEHNATKQVLGAIDLCDFDPFNMRAGIGILVDSNFQRRGYALQALDLVGEYAFSFLHLKQLYAEVPITNIPSLKLFEKAQFTHIATLPNWIRCGHTYNDVTIWQKANCD